MFVLPTRILLHVSNLLFATCVVALFFSPTPSPSLSLPSFPPCPLFSLTLLCAGLSDTHLLHFWWCWNTGSVDGSEVNRSDSFSMESRRCGAWWIQYGEFMEESLCLNLHDHNLTSTLCKWVLPAQHTRLAKKKIIKKSNCQTIHKIWIQILLLNCLFFAIFNNIFGVLASCSMREFVTPLPCWKRTSQNWSLSSITSSTSCSSSWSSEYRCVLTGFCVSAPSE